MSVRSVKSVRLEASWKGKVLEVTNFKGNHCMSDALKQKAVYRTQGMYVRTKVIY